MEDIGDKISNLKNKSSPISVFAEEQKPVEKESHVKDEDDEMPNNLENGHIALITEKMVNKEKGCDEACLEHQDAKNDISIKEELDPEMDGSGVHIKGNDDEIQFKPENGHMLVIAEKMAKEEKELEQARLTQQYAKTEIPVKSETPELDESMFTKLDSLLTQTQLYSEFLLEKMDDITMSARANVNAESTRGRKRGRAKRAAAGNAAHKKARVAVEVMLTNREKNILDESSDILLDEESLRKEQMELIPLMTGGRLKSYQMKGVKWMVSLWQNGLNGILADQMGLGKTVQTIGLLAHLKGEGLHGPFLVVAPLSTLSNWVNEFNRFVPSMKVLLYHGSKNDRAGLRREHMPKTVDPDPTFPVVITSYEVVMFDRRFLTQYKWAYLVVDEGHRLKNYECRLLRELKLLSPRNTLLLTGTPLHNNLAELWSLLNFILPQIFTSIHEFESWFDLSGRNMNGTAQEEIDEKRRVQVISRLHAILRPFLLRRLKEDVEKDLPLKKEIILYARMTKCQKEIQDHLINRTLIPYLHNKSVNGTRAHKANLDNLMIQMRKNFNHPDLLQSQFEISFDYPPVNELMEQCGKFQLLDRLLKHLKARGHKVLVFSQWTRVLDLLEYCLSEMGHEMCRIDGKVKLADRQRQINDFNNPGSNLHIFLLSTRAGGLGINLASADTCIIYDSDWNPQMDLQAMDRCHRIGQTKPVHVYRLCTAHSAECRMLKVASGKLKLEHVVIEKGQFCQDRTIRSLFKESDLLALLTQERDEEEELVQSQEISEMNLLQLLDRSDMVQGSPKAVRTYSNNLPLKGPGWEVVIRAGKVENMLSSVEGYKHIVDTNMKQGEA
ncbi:hypothetical protein SUGI_0081570 [Cryptomeria japonica]|uniref:ATP-dependent DNA helicase DDM1 n=1 Tax=Cryptomeria japonica TaxID=3369 RepID=UPI002408E430|nr:ATP-dependent DNA helicase DDM1 [Cryptomeria japonica]GLJ08114.1 hypothetical protein SUGI_0081570 [Cryptomeria japonica]